MTTAAHSNAQQRRARHSTVEHLRLRADDLRVHPTAQRELSKAHVRSIRASLNLDSIGTISVVRYAITNPSNGGLETAWWVVDGQHRIAALIDEGLGDWEVEINYYPDVNDAASASRLFIDLNHKKTPAPYDLYVNEVRAGEEAAVGVKKTVEENGFVVLNHSRDGTIAAVVALKKIYTKGGRDCLDSVLKTVSSAWGHTAPAVDAKILEGVGEVYRVFNGQIDRATLVKKLSKFSGGAAGLLGQAKARRDWRKASLGRCVGEMVVDAYNSNKRSGKLEGF